MTYFFQYKVIHHYTHDNGFFRLDMDSLKVSTNLCVIEPTLQFESNVMFGQGDHAFFGKTLQSLTQNRHGEGQGDQDHDEAKVPMHLGTGVPYLYSVIVFWLGDKVQMNFKMGGNYFRYGGKNEAGTCFMAGPTEMGDLMLSVYLSI